MTDVTTVTHRPRSAGSQLTVSSGSSIASGISQDIELGSRSSAAAPNGVASITRNYAARSSTGGVRRREFKARHIQMMSLGSFSLE
jgi:amino acid permease